MGSIGGIGGFSGATGYAGGFRADSRNGPQGGAQSGSSRNAASQGGKVGSDGLDDAQQKAVATLKARDTDVHAHEQAHMAAGGRYAGSASYTYETGPDGKRYAIGGEVPIDTGAERTPEATMAKMRQVRAAALAPADPSGQDLKVAASTQQAENKARSEANAKASSKAGSGEGGNGGTPGKGQDNAAGVPQSTGADSNPASAGPASAGPASASAAAFAAAAGAYRATAGYAAGAGASGAAASGRGIAVAA